MLVLTRKVGERIMIGDHIVIQMLEVNRGSIKIGIEAPETVPVFRFEVYDRIQQENLCSAKAGGALDIKKAAQVWQRTKGKATP
jgi:carbon storage regulator